MDNVTIEIRGLKELQGKFNKLPADLKQEITRSLEAATYILHDAVAKYPPATAANRPPGKNGRWYVRGTGTVTASGKTYRTSKQLGKSWTTKVSGLRGVVGNPVPYAPYVQSKDKQAWYHKANGWQTIETVAEKNKPRIVKIIEAAVAKVLQGQ